MSMKRSSSGSLMWRRATSPVLEVRKLASVRQARGCLANSAHAQAQWGRARTGPRSRCCWFFFGFFFLVFHPLLTVRGRGWQSGSDLQ